MIRLVRNVHGSISLSFWKEKALRIKDFFLILNQTSLHSAEKKKFCFMYTSAYRTDGKCFMIINLHFIFFRFRDIIMMETSGFFKIFLGRKKTKL